MKVPEVMGSTVGLIISPSFYFQYRSGMKTGMRGGLGKRVREGDDGHTNTNSARDDNWGKRQGYVDDTAEREN